MNTIHSFRNHIFNADCLDVFPRLPDESIDLVFTDPPYLVRYRDRQGRSIVNDDGDEWLKPAFAQAFRVLRPGHFCVSFYGWPKADTFLRAWRAAGFVPVGHLVWVKSYASASRFVAGRHETAYLLRKGHPQKPELPMPDVLTWYNTGNWLHPNQKPVPALKPVIEAFSQPGDLVLDPFCGSGSTLLAAKILSRDYLGVELNQAFCQTAQRRLRANG